MISVAAAPHGTIPAAPSEDISPVAMPGLTPIAAVQAWATAEATSVVDAVLVAAVVVAVAFAARPPSILQGELSDALKS